jgi:hypothetical protein
VSSGAIGGLTGADSGSQSGGRSAVTAAPSSQQARTSSPWIGLRFRSSPQNPSVEATEPRKFRHVPQLVDERWQTQQRDASA